MSHDNQHESFKSDIEDYAQLWDQMQGELPEPEKINPSLAYTNTNPHIDDPYFQALDLQLLSEAEDTSTSTPDIIGPDQVVTSEINPIHPTSSGPDASNTPPVWIDNKMIEEIEEIKNKMFEIENKIASAIGGNGEWQEKAYEPDHASSMKEITKLREKLEELSSKVGLEKGCDNAHKKRQHMGFNS